jgi:hypothetical protein
MANSNCALCVKVDEFGSRVTKEEPGHISIAAAVLVGTKDLVLAETPNG